MQKAWGKPFPQCAARFLNDNLSKELSTSSLDLRSQRHVPQLLIQLKNTFDFSGATHKQIKLLWCSGRGPGKRQALIQRRLLLLWSWHQHLFCSRSLQVWVTLLLHLILPVKPFAPQEPAVSSPECLRRFRPLHQAHVLCSNVGHH